jgi:hypothetical protein
MTVSVFVGLWISLTGEILILSQTFVVTALLASMTGLGEQQIGADHLVADFEK